MTQSYVVMTPYTLGNMKIIRFERTHVLDEINKECKLKMEPMDVPEMQLQFTCAMFNNRTSETHAENRCLKFWFSKKCSTIRSFG
ncbi:unnamed protein product [Schistosoma turkestanicum]|nr:unnamed protein product [Schistosoma turkestanicum]